MKELTTKQQQAFDLRSSGSTLAEIAAVMGTGREAVRQLIAAARYKMGMVPEAMEQEKPPCTCLRCGAAWTPRADNPIQCPRCKRVDWAMEK